MSKLYLYKKDNKLIVLFFAFIALLNLLVIAYKKDIMNGVGLFFSITGVTILQSIALFWNKKIPSVYRFENADDCRHIFIGAFSREEIKSISSEHPYWNYINKRKSHVKNLISIIDTKLNENDVNFKCLFLTGDSGSGKSMLVNILKTTINKEYSSKGWYAVLENEYDNFENLSNVSNKSIIILDQFEDALNKNNDVIFDLECFIKDNRDKNIVYIICCQQSSLTRVKNYFVNKKFCKPIENTYVLCMDDTDLDFYIDKISRKFKILRSIINGYVRNNENRELLNNSNCKELCDKLIDVKKGKAPLIELEIIGYIIERKVEGYYINDDDEHSFFELDLNHWVNNFLFKEMAYNILFLLSEFKTYNNEDVKIVAFDNNDNLKNSVYIYRALAENPFIDVKITGDDIYYTAKHQYISEQFRIYCQSKEISSNSRAYIAHLRKSKNNSLNGDDHCYLNIKKNYNQYYKKHYGISSMLVIMLISILLINVYRINDSLETHFQLALNAMVCLPSMYYIYNYCRRFLIISNNFTVKLTYIIGGTVIAASNIFLDWWGALFGTEIIILSFSILYTFILNNKARLVKKVFQKDAIIFFFIGLAILSLGIMFGFLFPIENIVLIRDGTNNKLLILTKICKYSYYILFSVYSVLSVCTHINYSYIIGRIGLANINH